MNLLQPNPSTSVITTAQSLAYNKAELRMSDQQNFRYSSNSTDQNFISAGDLSPTSKIWLSGFGGYSKQQAQGDYPGYYCKMFGAMLGLDHKADNDDIYGVAFGMASSNVTSLLNTESGLHIGALNAMIYALNYWKNDIFSESMLNAVLAHNKNMRNINFNGYMLSTTAGYNTSLVGMRVNVGKHYNLAHDYILRTLGMAQYGLVNQPQYDETGSVAAFNVRTISNQGIFTLGAGARIGKSFVLDDVASYCEVKALLSYDVISPVQLTTATFLVGSYPFNMLSSPSRFALNLGLNYIFTLSDNVDMQFYANSQIRSGYYYNFAELKVRYLF